MKNRSLAGSLCLFVVLIINCASAQVKLPVIIGNNMVLQRNQDVPVWGWARPGTIIKVDFSGQEKTTTALKDSSWKITFDPLTASFQPAEMDISSKDTTIKLTNILVGEVWLCSGQSNMEYTMKRTYQAPPAKGVDSAALELSITNNQIRLFKVNEALDPVPVFSKGWKESGGDALAEFSTVGYYFARDISSRLHVPVGMIFSAFGGTPIEFWIPAEAYKNLPASRADSIRKQPFMVNKYNSALYNRMISPLAPFALKGFLWYQGETNCTLNETVTYTDKMRVMIDDWREAWDDKKLPFYYVLIAPFYYTNFTNIKHTPQNLPEFWQAQIDALKIPYTEIASVTDLVDDLKDIHPSYKWEAGRRMSLLALAKTYNYHNLEYSGPRYKRMKIKGNRIILYFSHADGLKSPDGAPLNWFTIAGKDNVFVNADAVIQGDKIIISSPQVPNPVNVKFAWDETARPNFFNSANLPAFPFQTNVKP